MIDFVNQPVFTTIECHIDDLPVVLREKVKVQLYEREEVLLCIVTREYTDVLEVFVITTHRVAHINGFTAKGPTGEVRSGAGGMKILDHKDSSLLFANYSGFISYEEERATGWSTTISEFHLQMHATNHSVNVRVFGKEMFNKFMRTLTSAVSTTLSR